MAVSNNNNNNKIVLREDAGSLKTSTTKEKILDEDDYVDAMGKIIQRDFFPDLDRLRTHNEYLDAFAEGDVVRMRDVSERLRCFSATPATGTTGGRAAGCTGESSDLRGSARAPSAASSGRGSTAPSQRTSQADAAVHSAPRSATANADLSLAGEDDDELQFGLDGDERDRERRVDKLTVKKSGAPMSLDEFSTRHTSEDNASFREIMNVGLEEKRQRYAWLYKKEADAAAAVQAITDQTHLAIKGTDGGGAGEQQEEERKPIDIESWKYTPKNALMYVPDGVEKSAREKIETSKKQKRMVVYGNTRLARAIRSSQEISAAGAVNKAADEAVRREQFAVDGNELGLEKSPSVNGYGFVATPSMTPGVGASPLMTWGTVEGTPFRLDASDMLGDASLAATPGAPNFQILDPPRREALGHKLAEKVGLQHRAKKKNALKAASKSLGKKTPTSASSSVRSSMHSSERISALSPAAKRLVTGGRVLRSGDASLRSSYSPKVWRTPGSPWMQRSSPRSTRRTASTTPQSSAGSSRAGGGRMPPSPKQRGASLTDNLLKL